MSDNICTICHAPLNEDGTTEFCAGECDRQVVPEPDSMRELNFNDPVTISQMNDMYEDMYQDDVDYVDYDDLPELPEDWSDDDYK